jgi:hypothetical protein
MNIRLSSIALPLIVAFGIFSSFSCSWYYNCSEETFDNKINFGKYVSKDYFDVDGKKLIFNIDTLSLIYMVHQFSFNEDSTFSYLQIRSQHSNAHNISRQDTITMLNGNFRISEDSGLPWYVLELNADYIYEKEVEEKLSGISYYADFSQNEFNGFINKFFKKMDNNGCFTMYRKYGTISPIKDDYSCDAEFNYYEHEGIYWKLSNSDFRTFCLEQQPSAM